MILIVGLPRSGTTWHHHLILNNFQGTQGLLPWGADAQARHGLPEDLKVRPRYIVVVRKRLDHWLTSVQRTQSPFRKHMPDLYDSHNLLMAEAADYHDEFYTKWRYHVRDMPHYWAEYEETLKNPERYLATMEGVTGLSRLSPTTDLRGPTNDRMPDVKREYYLDEGIWGKR